MISRQLEGKLWNCVFYSVKAYILNIKNCFKIQKSIVESFMLATQNNS